MEMFRRGGKLSVLSGKDDRIKIINERINLSEKHFIELCNAFRNVAQRIAKQRDAFDELAKCFKTYSNDEEIHESLQEGLRSYANAVTIIGDFMDIKVHRMETKIVNELLLCENVAKSTRDNLRSAVIARDKEVLKQRQLLEIKAKFSANNSAADSELMKAKLEVNRTNKEIDELSINFEQRKIDNIKSMLHNFILISMKYHTKALEVLSASYYDVTSIDEKSDLLEYKNLLQAKQEKSSRNLSQRLSQSMESLDRDQLLSPLQRSSKLSKSKPSLDGGSDEVEQEEMDEEEVEEEEEEEDESDEDEAEDVDSETSSGSNAKEKPAINSRNQFKLNSRLQETEKTRKPSSGKQPFKATAQALKHAKPQTRRSLFEARGIPRNETDIKVVTAGRLVTLVESKKK